MSQLTLDCQIQFQYHERDFFFGRWGGVRLGLLSLWINKDIGIEFSLSLPLFNTQKNVGLKNPQCINKIMFKFLVCNSFL